MHKISWLTIGFYFGMCISFAYAGDVTITENLAGNQTIQSGAVNNNELNNENTVTANGGTSSATGGDSDATASSTQDQEQSMTNVIHFDGNKNNVLAYSAPGLAAAQGTNTVQGHSLFGGVSLSNDENYIKILYRLDAIAKFRNAGILEQGVADEMLLNGLQELEAATEAPKFLLITPWKCNGRSIFTLLGLLCG